MVNMKRVFVGLGMCVGLAAGAQPSAGLLGPVRLVVSEPSAKELVDRAKAAPSLMFRAADLPAIRRRLAEDPDAKAWWEGFRKALDANIAKGVKVPPCGAQWYHWYSCRKCGAQLRGESPTRHMCAKCGEVHSGWPYDDAYWFPIQHQCGYMVRDAGVAWAITGERRYADVAKGLLLDYAKVYLSWPRHDNWSKATDRNPDAARAFSQVLDESVWMIDLVRGFDAISGTLTEEERQTIFTRVFKPAADIIYKRDDVGHPILGNHQCWHFLAYALAALVMGDVARVRESIDGLSGWKYQLSRGILEDGCWYEGAWGYQFYTMSSLAPYFTALRNLGYEPPAAFKRLFDSPFGQLAPDWFLPAVNDTARVRFAPGALADLYEQAWTWWGDPQHGWWVAQQPRRTMAYALWGRPARKDAAFTPPASRNFGSSGLAVLRSRSPAAKGPLPDNMLAMDYGPHGGWHGHHDKLQLLLWGRGRMWGEDPGCIAYGNPRHWGWYRSTLAHNTLAMDGRNQAPAQGRLVGYAAGGNAAVVAADSGEAYPGATVRRATALVDDIVLDFAEVSADSAHEWEWAFHARGKQETSVTNGVAVPTAPPEIDVRDRRKVEAAQDMDHWLWVENVREGAHDGTWHSVWRQGGDALHLFQKSPAGTLRTGAGPAQPPPEKFRLAVNRVTGGRHLAFRTVMTLDGSADVQIGDEIARNGWHGFSATVGGRRFELMVNGENVRLVEKDGTGKAVRDLSAKR